MYNVGDRVSFIRGYDEVLTGTVLKKKSSLGTYFVEFDTQWSGYSDGYIDEMFIIGVAEVAPKKGLTGFLEGN